MAGSVYAIDLLK